MGSSTGTEYSSPQPLSMGLSCSLVEWFASTCVWRDLLQALEVYLSPCRSSLKMDGAREVNPRLGAFRPLATEPMSLLPLLFFYFPPCKARCAQNQTGAWVRGGGAAIE